MRYKFWRALVVDGLHGPDDGDLPGVVTELAGLVGECDGLRGLAAASDNNLDLHVMIEACVKCRDLDNQMIWVKIFFERRHNFGPGGLHLAWLDINKVNLSVFKKVFTNNPQFSPAPRRRDLGVGLEDLWCAGQLGAVDRV